MDPQEEFILAGLVYMFFVTVLYFMEGGESLECEVRMVVFMFLVR